jgi:RNase H-fold protein (predicted Holliday junction resolvase)
MFVFGMKDYLLLEHLIYLVNLDVNVSKREKNIDQNAAAFILQGAIDFLNN